MPVLPPDSRGASEQNISTGVDCLAEQGARAGVVPPAHCHNIGSPSTPRRDKYPALRVWESVTRHTTDCVMEVKTYTSGEVMPSLTDHELSYSFPAIRGVLAAREYYVAMMRPKHVIKLLSLDRSDLSPERRSQRGLNPSRVPSLSRYLLENPRGYVFSSLTASVSGQVRFEPLGTGNVASKLGTLHLSADAPITINDGQHRRAAIEEAIKHNPSLGSETISVVLFVDAGLARSQQMFADLNRFAIRPAQSLTILYDHRDHLGQLTTRLIERVPVFRGLTETARTTISNRARKLFTLSSIYRATRKLLSKRAGAIVSHEEEDIAVRFWTRVAAHVPDWQAAAEGRVSPCDLRRDYIHAHGVALQALAIAGNDLLRKAPAD